MDNAKSISAPTKQAVDNITAQRNALAANVRSSLYSQLIESEAAVARSQALLDKLRTRKPYTLDKRPSN